MQLSKETLTQIKPQPELQVPGAKLFELTEKVLQFGTGVLLRGLPDYFFHKANTQGLFNGRVVAYWDAFQEQKSELDLESRKIERFGSSYAVSKQIADFIKTKHRSDVVLMPSTAYFNANGIDYHVPEPAVFYYFTSVKTIWQNCKSGCNANWFVYANNGRLGIDTIQNKAVLDSVLKVFNKYETSL